MQSANSRGQPITGINVTPLVDVTLVLLIIFMVTAKLIVENQALSVDLPKASTGNEVQDILSLVLAESGRAEVNGSPIELDSALLPLARSLKAGNPELRAVIKADGQVRHERVMLALDLLRQAGISKIGFGVVPLPVAPNTQPASR